jgi:heme exporter protein B
MMRFIRQSLVIAGKDLLLELRSRERLLSMLTFAVLVAVVFNFSLDPTVRVEVAPGRYAPIAGSIGGAMLWVTILFAGMLGLGRSFSLEREQDALVGIVVAPIDRGALFFGKLIANLALLVVAVVALFLVYGLFFQLPLLPALGGLALVTLLACIGFMALGTLFSAVTAGTRLGDSLLPIVLLPLLIPVVIFAASATQRLLQGRPLDEVLGNVRMLAAFDLIFVVVCTMVFGSVVEE